MKPEVWWRLTGPWYGMPVLGVLGRWAFAGLVVGCVVAPAVAVYAWAKDDQVRTSVGTALCVIGLLVWARGCGAMRRMAALEQEVTTVKAETELSALMNLELLKRFEAHRQLAEQAMQEIKALERTPATAPVPVPVPVPVTPAPTPTAPMQPRKRWWRR